VPWMQRRGETQDSSAPTRCDSESAVPPSGGSVGIYPEGGSRQPITEALAIEAQGGASDFRPAPAQVAGQWPRLKMGSAKSVR
jgi:hypothetical protein